MPIVSPTINELMEKVDCRYTLVVEASKRARQLVDGVLPLIGFHAQGNYSTAVGESYALMGMALWAEYLNGIAKITVNAQG